MVKKPGMILEYENTAPVPSSPRPAQRGEGRVRGVLGRSWRSHTKAQDIKLRGYARQLRQNSTDVEMKFWRLLRRRNIEGIKFRRQHPIGPYIVDFCCQEKGLVIEFDGGQHAQSIRYDRQRTRFLQTQGYRVLRVWDNEALTNTNGVLEKALEMIEDNPSPCPLPVSRGEGKKKE